jgi:hypothetical protein
MPSGGARNKSGPRPQEGSGRSEARGYSLAALPAEGFSGEVPEWTLPKRVVYYTEWEDKRPVRHIDLDATEHVAEREQQLWEWAWRTPQACAWSMRSEHWRHYAVSMWVRTAVICESSEATAADKNSLHRFADQIGFTDAGLAAMGWKVAVDEVSEKAASRPKSTTPAPRRLRAAGSAGG